MSRLLSSLLLLTVLIVVVVVAASHDTHAKKKYGGGLRRQPQHTKKFVVTSPVPEFVAGTTPSAFDWSNVSGVNYLTASRNQHIPTYCGSCWAMATTTALADRLRLLRQRAWPDYMLAVQEIVNCIPDGCAGGDPDTVHAWIHQNGIAADTCQNYIAFGSGTECRPERRCETCNPDGTCTAITEYPTFGVAEYGDVTGPEAMMAEIAARGPIACGIDSEPIVAWGFGPNRTGIFEGGQDQWAIDHEISVVGYGIDETDGTPYWRIRNSWGEYWGDRGFFRLRMHQNQLGIETNPCSWAVPKLMGNQKP